MRSLRPPSSPPRFARAAVLVILTTFALNARADFDPNGRKHHGGGSKPVHGGGGTKPPVAHKPPSDGGGETTKGPSRDALIARYTGIVLSQPGTTFPLERLAQLYRERDGDLKKLLDDFEKRASDKDAKDAWNAKVALAGILKIEGRFDDAIKTYEGAIEERPKESGPRLALAQLRQERGDKEAARKDYDAALALLTNQADKETTLRALRTLTLDAKDFDAAKKYHAELVKISGGSLAVRAELGKELLARNETEKAEAELAEVVKAATGDNRALAPALLDLGRAQAAEKKNKEALETLKKALAAAGSEGGIRTEILSVTADVYRQSNDLPALVELLEKEHAQDFQRLVMLGSLYEETGDVAKAIATYRRALAVNGKNVETRLKVVRLLQAQGELDAAIAENEKLIQAAPKNPDFVFQLVETLLQRGDRARALDLLSKLERSAGNDDDVLTRLADFYERIDEKDRATKIFAHLAQVAPADPTHLVELGDRYWQEGDRKKAVDTWQRIRTSVPNKTKALTALGEVFLDHDMVVEALAALKEASDAEPQNLRAKKTFAAALERAGTIAGSTPLRNARFDEARAVWEEILGKAASDRLLAREARTHIVTLWSLLNQLSAKVEPLKRRLDDDPPDLEAGRLLADVQMKLRKLDDAEATLAKVTSKAPGDEDAFLALERVRVLKHDLPGAIKALEKLVAIDPNRAREFYQRMAQYSAELYKDDDAIKYAEKAVALSPEDAEGHRKLAEMYRRHGDVEHAMSEFRMAIQKNDRLYPVYMELAEMYVAKGDADEADKLYRRVVRMAPDEELVAQAGRLSMQRNLVKGTLHDLENELLPLTLGHPQKPVYRRLLVDVYGQMAFPLVQRVRFGTDEEAKTARAELEKIGSRGVKPLLDALSDEQKSQVTTAIEVLSFVGNRGAAPALAAFAVGNAEQPLRVRAMIATGALRDPALLPRYEELVAPKGEEPVAPGDPVTVAAAWAVARMGDKKAVPLLERMLDSGSPEVRAFGAIGLGLARDKAAVPKLEAIAKSNETALSFGGAAASSRAAAAVALGEIGSAASAPVLVSLAHGSEPVVRAAAIGALVRLADPAAISLAMDALLSPDPTERRVAANALVALTTKDTARHGDPLPVTSGGVDVESSIEGFLPNGFSPAAFAKTLVSAKDDLAKSALAGARSSSDKAAVVAGALLARGDGNAAYAPFTDGLESLGESDRKAAEDAARAIRAAVVPAFAELARHPSPALRVLAIRVLAGSSDDRAVKAILDAIGDEDEHVTRVALAAVTVTPNAPAASKITALLAQPSWALRVVAAETLGPVAARQSDDDAKKAWEALARAAKDDPFAVVRAAALKSLALAKTPEAIAVLREAAEKDAEPDVRKTAADLAR